MKTVAELRIRILDDREVRKIHIVNLVEGKKGYGRIRPLTKVESEVVERWING